MKRFIITALFSLGFGSVALAAPGQIYYNTGFNTNLPIIDDVIFENTGTFEAFVAVSEEIISLYLPDLSYAPYSTRNTLYYTNAGVMEGTPGFLFATTTATTSRGASSFANVSGGVVAAFDDEVLAGGAILTFYGEAAPSLFDTDAAKTYVPDVIYSQPLASQVLIHSTNILNNGTISVGNYGQLQMTGKNINNAGGVLVAGAVNTGSDTDPADTTSGAEFLFDDLNFYVNPAGVYDLFWGVTNGTTLKLDQFAVDLPDTGIDAPLNVTLRGQGNSTFQFPMPLNGNPRFATFVYAYEFNASNTYFNIVFVNTNFTDVNGQANTNITATVEFSPENIAIGTGQSGDVFAYMAMVQFAMPVFDVITRGVVTNAVYLLDDGAAFNPMTEYLNAGSANNYNRPNAFVITTETPDFWETPSAANQANYPYDPSLIYEANTYSGKDVTYAAAEYGAQIGRNPADLEGGFDFQSAIGTNEIGTNNAVEGDISDFYEIVTLPDPTNEPARIELTANQLNLSNSLLRAEGMVIVNATNLAGTAAGYDWGEINAQLGATNGSLVVSNFFPTNFQRLRGDVYAWAATWVNTFTNGVTNTFHYHLLVVDQNLGGNFQSAIRNLSLTGSNSINVQDSVYVINQSWFNTTNLTFSSNAVFTQNAESLVGANMPKLKNFLVNTNGVLEVDNVLDIGLDQTKIQAPPLNRKYTIASIENLGIIEATAPLFQSAFFENDYAIESSSSMTIEAQNLGMGLFLTNQVNYMVAGGDIDLSAQNMRVTNSYIYTGYSFDGLNNASGGSLTLQTSPVGEITDGVPGTPATNNVLNNFWQVTDGFNLPVKPATGDLFGTEIETIAANPGIAQHIWAGRGDYTNVVDGFANNMVIGHLMLSRQTNTAELHFSGAGTQNGMYVDYLELDTNSLSGQGATYRDGLVIDPNLTIYFADCNLDPIKVESISPGRLVWVTNFWGPNSTMWVTNELHTNQVCAVNAAVADSIDPAVSFFPGTPNFENQPYVLNNPDPPHNWFNTNGDCPSFTITDESAVMLEDLTNFASFKGTYNGLFYDTNQLSSANSGFFTFTLSKNGAFSGRLLMGPSNYTFSGSGSGKFNTSGAARVTAKHGSQSLTVNLQLGTTVEGTIGVQGCVSNETWAAQLQGDLQPDWTAKNPSPYAGQYTIVLTNGGTNSVPIGDSYGSLTISKLGVLSVAGKLADGNAFSQSVPISTNGLWPFYTYVDRGGDFLLGWVALQSSDSEWTADASGAISPTNVFWSKASSSKNRYYPAGFTNTFNLAGSPYTVPGKNSSGLALTNPAVILSGGDLIAATNTVASNGKLMFTNSNLTLSINPKVGSFTGQYSGIKMDGVVLQNQEEAFGFFFGINDETGTVLLQGRSQ